MKKNCTNAMLAAGAKDPCVRSSVSFDSARNAAFGAAVEEVDETDLSRRVSTGGIECVKGWSVPIESITDSKNIGFGL